MSYIDIDSDISVSGSLISQLRYLYIDSLGVDEECPICRISYSTSVAEFSSQIPGHQRFLAFQALPFQCRSSHAGLDLPVCLPCASGHVVGSACIIHLAEGGGRTCPLDREEIFRPSRDPTARAHENDINKYIRGVRTIERMSIRELLRRYRNANENDVVMVNAAFMVRRLDTLIIRVILHRAGLWQTRIEPRRTRVPNASGLLSDEQAPAFRRLAQRLGRREPPTDSGQYPSHVVELFNPALPHVYALLYRLAQVHQATTISVLGLACMLHDRLRQFFHDFSSLIMNEENTHQEHEWEPLSSDRPPYFSIDATHVGYYSGAEISDRGSVGRPTTLTMASWTRRPSSPSREPDPVLRRAVLFESDEERARLVDESREVVHVPDYVFTTIWESTHGPPGVRDASHTPSVSNSAESEDIVRQVMGVRGNNSTMGEDVTVLANHEQLERM